ncbi:PstS family phosphate ABC transporter substrate-binding protein [Reichenbachiella versicolor]|uniref:PstS family phosphate ABC transporter substrate-binding protein n=1 Tax=Reichenbachiella versicolor TaxID=1821036 RepID=UPI000D6DFC6F|nr:PstS family phosphate ABC transporter substrate-binding protein [Reichenbachiella versicolor]
MRVLYLLITLYILIGCQSNKSEKFTVKLKGSESMFGSFKALKNDFESIQDSIKLELEGGGSKTALPSVANGLADIGLSSYPFDVNDILGKGHGVDEMIVAYDGIIIINNESNPIDQLTNEQITGIYDGTYTDWGQIGGRPGIIKPIIRDENSGTQKFFREHFRLDTIPDYALVAEKNNEIVAKVNADPNSIGYIGFAYVTLNVKDVKVPSTKSIDDSMFIYPSTRTISEGHYPLKRSLRIYFKSDKNDYVKAFLSYIRSNRGKDILDEQGLIVASSMY